MDMPRNGNTILEEILELLDEAKRDLSQDDYCELVGELDEDLMTRKQDLDIELEGE